MGSSNLTGNVTKCMMLYYSNAHVSVKSKYKILHFGDFKISNDRAMSLDRFITTRITRRIPPKREFVRRIFQRLNKEAVFLKGNYTETRGSSMMHTRVYVSMPRISIDWHRSMYIGRISWSWFDATFRYRLDSTTSGAPGVPCRRLMHDRLETEMQWAVQWTEAMH